MGLLSESEVLALRVEKLRLRPQSVKKHRGFPGARFAGRPPCSAASTQLWDHAPRIYDPGWMGKGGATGWTVKPPSGTLRLNLLPSPTFYFKRHTAKMAGKQKDRGGQPRHNQEEALRHAHPCFASTVTVSRPAVHPPNVRKIGRLKKKINPS